MNPASNQDESLARAFSVLHGDERDRQAAIMRIDALLGRQLERYFLRHRVPEADAEEMVWNVWLALLTSEFRHETRPAVWIWTIARNQMISFHRRAAGESAHRDVLDDDGWCELVESVAAPSAPAWITVCLERALAEFETDHPERAQVLRMMAEEWSAQEVGEYFGCSEGAARDRVYRARERAREYLAQCRDVEPK